MVVFHAAVAAPRSMKSSVPPWKNWTRGDFRGVLGATPRTQPLDLCLCSPQSPWEFFMTRCGATWDENHADRAFCGLRLFVSEFDPKPQTSLKSRRSTLQEF